MCSLIGMSAPPHIVTCCFLVFFNIYPNTKLPLIYPNNIEITICENMKKPLAISFKFFVSNDILAVSLCF